MVVKSYFSLSNPRMVSRCTRDIAEKIGTDRSLGRFAREPERSPRL